MDKNSDNKENKKPERSESSLQEEEVLEFWNKNNIFGKSLKKDSTEGEFIFYDGPPFATGTPHYGHILASTIKDVIPRYKTMRGYYVPRRWGWDCHGLPLENIIEKELGLKTKKDIQEFGIEKFNEASRKAVFRYADEWKKFIPRVGRWVDMEESYKTMDGHYTESVWWAFKELFNKEMIYEGFKSMHLCPRCETTLSNFEVSQGYKDITDISVFVKFKIKKGQKLLQKEIKDNTYLLAWTTTPWTLPGNVALAVGLDINYVKIKDSWIHNNYDNTNPLNKETPPPSLKKTVYYILAKDLFEKYKDKFKNSNPEIIEEFKGEELTDLSYEPLFPYYSSMTDLANKENGWKIYSADFVATDEGSGIVHIAPAFGEDDYNLSITHKLPFVQHINSRGEMKPEVSDFKDLQAKPKEDHQSTDIEIIKYLSHRELLFAKEKVAHSYPHCWRCDTPLLNYGTSSWFVKVSDIKNKLVKENEKIKWVPEEIGKYRFGNWLSEARDWAISRSRFWGAPLPVWKCNSCQEVKVVGNMEDLLENQISPWGSNNEYIVMRHGEAEQNVSEILSSNPDNPHHLTERGISQIDETIKKLKEKEIGIIISSDIIRTKETAKRVSEVLDISYETDKRLREVDFGDLDGKSVSDFRVYYKTYAEGFEKATPNGESYADIRKRLGELINELEEKYSGKKILLVTHETPAWILKTLALGSPDEDADKIRGKESDYLKTAEIMDLPILPLPRNKEYAPDLHKPYIDEVKFKCSCGGEMKRIEDVFDCWFESGSMPFAQAGYPKNKETFNPQENKEFPADFIAEGLDQTRGWFYSMLILSYLLFKRSAYKSVVVNGLILAENGQKMSKKLKNYPDPNMIVDKYGADALRLYMLSSPVVRSQDLNFSERGVDEINKKTLGRFKNAMSFYKLYSTPSDGNLSQKEINNLPILDKWIIARLAEVLKTTTEKLDMYELDRASRPLGEFVSDFSQWYIRRSREAVKSEDEKERRTSLDTTHFVLREFSKICAPFIPFLSENIYQQLKRNSSNNYDWKESVHLEQWSQFESVGDGENLLENMRKVREISSLGLEARAKSGIKVRQPLSSITLKDDSLKNDIDLLEIIKDELNVKEVSFDSSLSDELKLDTNITAELKKEGDVREIIRFVQNMRKNEKLTPDKEITLIVKTTDEGRDMLENAKSELKRVARVVNLEFVDNIEDGNPLSLGEIEIKAKIRV